VAEILFWAATQPDLVPASQAHQVWTAGDVITVQRDGWKWGRKELDNPLWRVWRLPWVPEESLKDLLDDDVNKIGGESFRVRTRVRYLDLSSSDARAMLSRGLFRILDTSEVKSVLSWRRVKQALGQIG
jgi:hypothetical protein